MSEKNGYEGHLTGDKVIRPNFEKKPVKDELREEVENIFTELEKLLNQNEDRKFDPEGLRFVLRRIDELGQRTTDLGRKDLAGSLRYLYNALDRAMENPDDYFDEETGKTVTARKNIQSIVKSLKMVFKYN